MTNTRRSGGLWGLGDDPAPARNAPDIGRRLAWVLLTNRLHQPDPTYVDDAAMARALTERGAPTQAQDVRTWEAGVVPPSFAALAAWEQVCGAPPGSLTSVCAYLAASLPDVGAPVVRPERSGRTAELLGAVADRTIAPADWPVLSWHLLAEPDALSDGCADRVAGLLVRQLPRTVRAAYRQVSTAAMELATISRVQGPLIAQIRDYLADPDTQVMQNPMGMLDQIPTREAAALVLDLFERPPNQPSYQQAIWLATQKMAHGDFTPEERARLEVAVLAKWRSNAGQAQHELAQLIGVLPDGMQQTLRRAADHQGLKRLSYVLEYGEDVTRNRAASVSGAVATGARAAVTDHGVYADNPMLLRLVREALFHRESERRHLAALLLAASPFTNAVTDRLLELLADGAQPPALRHRAAVLVRYLAGGIHRLRMQRFVDDDQESVAVPIVQGLGHIPFSTTTDQVLRRTLPTQEGPLGTAYLYALGMTGSPGLEAIRASSSTPEWQQRAAGWWLRAGPAIS